MYVPMYITPSKYLIVVLENSDPSPLSSLTHDNENKIKESVVLCVTECTIPLVEYLLNLKYKVIKAYFIAE